MPSFEHRGRVYNNPVQLALSQVGGKWKMPILWRLRKDVLRFSEIRRSLNEHIVEKKITDKTLSQQLKELEEEGYITRKVYPVVPPKTEYTITERGLAVIPAIKVLQALGRRIREW